MRRLAPLLLFLLVRQAYSCPTDLKRAPEPSGPWVKYEAARQKRLAGSKPPAPPVLPSSSQSQLPTAAGPNPWGGTVPSKWTPEAMLANAASSALNAGWTEKGADDVLVSVPLKMLYGNFRPYGDAQSDASPRFTDPSDPTLPPWDATEPPLVATWTTFRAAPPELRLRFSRVFPDFNEKGTATLIYYIRGEKQPPKSLRVAKTRDGDFEASWIPAKDGVTLTWGGRFASHVAFVQAPGRGDWLPIDFRDVAVKTSQLLSEEPKRTYPPTGGSLLDPASLAPKAGEPLSAYQKLLAFHPEAFGNHSNFYATIPGVHNVFDGAITAVGDATSWVLWPEPAPFKMAYLCFDPRDEEAEADTGAPSGGGWHELGDPAETVINALEPGTKLVFGYANGQPSEPPLGGFFRKLTDVAVIRELKPGYAAMTTAGTTTLTEPSRGQGPVTGRNYHWLLFNQERPPLADGPNRICAVEWVHPCVPGASDPAGLACPH